MTFKRFSFLALAGLVLGLAISFVLSGCSCAHAQEHTYKYDTRTFSPRGYYYPRNKFPRRYINKPNVDNTKCQRPYWYDHSKCCKKVVKRVRTQ